MRRLIGGCFLLLLAVPAAQAELRVVGLFKDRAVVMVDGKRRMLKVGERSPEGVLLVSAYSAEAVLERDGEQRVYRLDGRAGGAYRERDRPEVRIHSRGEHYFQEGRVNGREVRFLVDTGATSITFNHGEARRLGLDYRAVGERIKVTTASGVTAGYRLRLNEVELGEIRVANVEAVVIEGEQPEVALLGMSFLGRVEMERKGTMMLLRGK